jgi:hypothetical protein
MADGTWGRSEPAVALAARLNEAGQPRASLWAICGCGCEAVLDPRPWLNQGLGRQPLHALEERVRCACGARRARLEIRGLAEAPARRAGIYPFL